jgi:hypothetical protein
MFLIICNPDAERQFFEEEEEDTAIDSLVTMGHLLQLNLSVDDL